MKQALLYIRVSTEEQVKYGYSIETQEHDLRKWCKDNDYNVKKVYADKGISGGSIEKRKGFMNMINESVRNDTIIFTKLDRFSRNLLDANMIVKQLEEKNVSIKAIFEDDIDTTTADGKFIFNLKLSLAQREREKTSERIKDVFNYKKSIGQTTTGSVPLGLKVVDKYVVIDDETSDIVKFLFETYDDLNNIQETYRCMIEKYGKVRSVSSIKNILKNKLYIGVKDENKRFCEPLIDMALFYRVQEKLSHNVKKTPTNNVYLFSRLIVCPSCGKRLYAHGYSDKTPWIYYHCASRNIRYESICHFKHVREDILEKQLIDSMPMFQDKTKHEFEKIKEHDYSKDIKKIERKIERLKELYIDGDIEKDTYLTKKQALEQRLDEIGILTRVEEKSSLNDILSLNIKEIYFELSKDDKQSFWHKFVERIEVDDKGNLKDIIFYK